MRKLTEGVSVSRLSVRVHACACARAHTLRNSTRTTRRAERLDRPSSPSQAGDEALARRLQALECGLPADAGATISSMSAMGNVSDEEYAWRLQLEEAAPRRYGLRCSVCANHAKAYGHFYGNLQDDIDAFEK